MSLSLSFCWSGHISSSYEQISERSQVYRIAHWRCSLNMFLFVAVFFCFYLSLYLFLSCWSQWSGHFYITWIFIMCLMDRRWVKWYDIGPQDQTSRFRPGFWPNLNSKQPTTLRVPHGAGMGVLVSSIFWETETYCLPTHKIHLILFYIILTFQYIQAKLTYIPDRHTS